MTATLRVFCRQMPEKELSIHTIGRNPTIESKRRASKGCRKNKRGRKTALFSYLSICLSRCYCFALRLIES